MDEVVRFVGGFGVLFAIAVLVKTMTFAPVDPVVVGASTFSWVAGSLSFFIFIFVFEMLQ